MYSMIKTETCINLFDYLVILGLLLASGTTYFYMLHAGVTLLSVLGLSFIYALRRGSVTRPTNSFLVIYSILIVICYLRYGGDMNLLGDVILLVSTYLVTSSISFRTFRYAFFNVIFVLAIISFSFQIAYWLDFIQPALVNKSDSNLYGFYLFAFHTFGGGKWGLNQHLSGLFWEPGVYQMALNMALIMNCHILSLPVRFIGKTDLTKYAVIVLAVVLTMSTTGYLTLGVIKIGILLKKSKKNIVWGIMLILSILVFILVIKNSKVVAGKFSDDSGSFLVRANDTICLINIITENPFFGSGVYSKTFFSLGDKYGLTGAASNGILLQIAQFGLLFGISFFWSLSREYEKRHLPISKMLYIMVVLFLCIGEPLVYAPLILIAVLPFKKYD